MVQDLEQQNFPNPSSAPRVFAADPEAVVEKPGNPYYADGVDVNYTAPAKWWNWLWNHISAWLKDSKADRASMNAEIENTLTAASVTPVDSDTHQLSQAVDTLAYAACNDYDNAVSDGHKVNQPYVVGNTLFIPDTELL